MITSSINQESKYQTKNPLQTSLDSEIDLGKTKSIKTKVEVNSNINPQEEKILSTHHKWLTVYDEEFNIIEVQENCLGGSGAPNNILFRCSKCGYSFFFFDNVKEHVRNCKGEQS